jgi:hypothetical protein
MLVAASGHTVLQTILNFYSMLLGFQFTGTGMPEAAGC